MNVVIIYLLSYFKKKEISHKNLEIERIQNQINLSQDRIKEIELQKVTFPRNLRRYQDLSLLVESFTKSLTLGEVVDILVNQSFSTVAQNEGVCILYLLDIERQSLNLSASKKQNPEEIIKAKNGDVFDRWVLKNFSNLLVSDTNKDFRFDLKKQPPEEYREIGSVISCPLILQERFLGILRLDNPAPNKFSLDDLRLLRTISDLGAIALENAITYEHTQDLAIKDSLTGLFQRSYFFERLNEEILRSIYQNSPLSLLMIDVDHFKDYNDRFGHMAGDLVLKNISKNLCNFFDRGGNLISRFGGEEFCVLLPGIDKFQAKEMAENFCYRIGNQQILIRRKPSKVTVSVGIANFPKDCREIKELLELADKALYKAKELGRNRVCTI